MNTVYKKLFSFFVLVGFLVPTATFAKTITTKQIIEAVNANAKAIQTFQFNGTVQTAKTTQIPDYLRKLQSSKKLTETTKNTYTLSGSFDNTNAASPRFQSEVNMADTSSEPTSALMFPVTVIADGKVTYLKMGDFIKSLLPPTTSFDWVKIDGEAIRNKLGLGGLSSELSKLEDNPTNPQKLLNVSDMYTFTRLADQKVNDQKMYHFRLAPKREFFLTYYPNSILEKNIVRTMKGEMWVDPVSLVPAKVTLTVGEKNSSLKTSSTNTVTLNFTHLNEAVSIEVPTTSIPVEDVISMFFSNLQNTFLNSPTSSM